MAAKHVGQRPLGRYVYLFDKLFIAGRMFTSIQYGCACLTIPSSSFEDEIFLVSIFNCTSLNGRKKCCYIALLAMLFSFHLSLSNQSKAFDTLLQTTTTTERLQTVVTAQCKLLHLKQQTIEPPVQTSSLNCVK